jgi:hypothetical protein
MTAYNGTKPAYHNTLNLFGSELKKRVLKAEGCTAKVLELYANSPNITITPWEAFQKLSSKWPITSIRRSISDLTDLNHLEKTNEKRIGPYDEPNYAWRLRK